MDAKVNNIILNIAVINSSKKVNIAECTEFCKATNLLINSVPWINISPITYTLYTHIMLN